MGGDSQAWEEIEKGWVGKVEEKGGMKMRATKSPAALKSEQGGQGSRCDLAIRGRQPCSVGFSGNGMLQSMMPKFRAVPGWNVAQSIPLSATSRPAEKWVDLRYVFMGLGEVDSIVPQPSKGSRKK